MRSLAAVGFVLALASSTACDAPTPPRPEGNVALGIARFTIDDSADVTTVRGLDARGHEVGRLDLVHGRFTLTGIFRDDYSTPEVVGRKLDIDVLGQQLSWETEGFDPTLHMPAVPTNRWAIAVFVDDPHVKAVLERWDIGFEAFAGHEHAYLAINDGYNGTFGATDCTGQTACGSVRGLTINTCGNSAAPTSAASVAMVNTWGGSGDQYKLAQCCPAGSGGQTTAWFGIKSCPTVGTVSECGSGTGACKACPTYPQSAAGECGVQLDAAAYAVTYSYSDGTGSWRDDFDRTTGLGTAWSHIRGGTTTDGTQAVSTNTDENVERAIPSPALTTDDYTVTTRMSIPAGTEHEGIFVRAADPNDYRGTLYSISLTTDHYVQLWRRNAYTEVHLTSAWMPIAADTMYTVKAVVTGSNPVQIQVWVDGVRKIVYNDWSANRLTSGPAGLQNFDPGVKYDYFKIEPTQALPTPPALPSGTSFVDDFNRYTNLGTNWGVRIGGFASVGGTSVQALSSEANGNWAHLVPDISVGNDYSVTAVLSVPVGGCYSGVFARASNPWIYPATNYSADICEDGRNEGGYVRLMKHVSWGLTEVDTYALPIDPGTFYTLKLVATGTNPVHLEVWLDGVQRIAYDDSDADRIASGVQGIMAYYPGVVFDSYRTDAVGP